MPPAAPWITRPATRTARLPATAQTRVPAANVARLASIIRFLPATSPSRPMTGVRMHALSRYAVEIQAASAVLTPRLTWIRGRAGMTSACIIAKTVPASASTASSAVVRTGGALAGARSAAAGRPAAGVAGLVRTGAEAFTRGLRGCERVSREPPSGLRPGESQPVSSQPRIARSGALTLPWRESRDCSYAAADHRRVLAPHPPEHQDAPLLPRGGPARARRGRPGQRLPVLPARPGAVGAAGQAVPRPRPAGRGREGGARRARPDLARRDPGGPPRPDAGPAPADRGGGRVAAPDARGRLGVGRHRGAGARRRGRALRRRPRAEKGRRRLVAGRPGRPAGGRPGGPAGADRAGRRHLRR